MKRILSVAALTAVMLVTMASNAHAASWRVNNKSAGKGAHFTSINAACSSEDVQAGDTLYLDPGCVLTSEQNVTKTLTIIGPGYFLSDLPFGSAAISAKLNLRAANIKVEGVILDGETYIQHNYVTIERCKTKDIYFSFYNNITSNNSVVRQCYVSGGIGGLGKTDNRSCYCTIENCIVQHNSYYDHAIFNFYYATIRNNYLREGYSSTNVIGSLSNCQITNNIIFNTGSKANTGFSNMSDCSLRNNIVSCATNSSYPDNMYLNAANEAAIFVMTGNEDEKYQLKDDSPAKGYAADGGDCGPFGGLFPYVLSGHPVGIPYFESMNTPTRSTNGQVKITQHVKLQTK